MSEIPRDERKRLEAAISEAMQPIMDLYKVSLTVKVWRQDGREGSNVIAFRR